jgi:DHA2 family multidrug resistance protein-like MFS transporter
LWALVATSIATFITTLSNSIANTALPTIVRSFHITSSESVWVVNGLQLATTSTLLFFASVGDARGAKRIFLIGLSIFTAATIGAALAPTFGVLVTMRVIQGLGGSLILVTINALNRALFSKEQLGRSVAMNAIFVAVGTAAGPTIGGIILSFAPWPWIFALNVPLGLISLALGIAYLPHIPATEQPLDYRSGLLAALGFGGIIYALDTFARHSGGLEATIAGIVGTVAMIVFVYRQLHLPAPMLAVELFRVPIFTMSVVASSATYTAQGLAYVSLPFFFQNVLGKTPLESGLLLSAWPLTALIVAIRIGPLSDRYPAPLLCTIGIVVMGLGLLGFALLPAMPPLYAIVLCAGVCGAGFATFQTPNNRAIIATAPPEKTGRAAGVMTTARLSGQTLGATLVAIIFAVAGSAAAARYVPERSVIEAALIAACVCMAIAAILSSIRLGTSSAPATT